MIKYLVDSPVVRARVTVILALCTVLWGAQSWGEDCSNTAVGENLILDTGFTTFGGRHNERQWSASEHTAQKSFKYTISEGVLAIEQVATEPWAIVTQVVDAKTVAGKTVKFSADIKLDLEQPTRAINLKVGGGLLMWVKKNGRMVLDSSMEHEPYMGKSDWVRVDVVKKIPAKANFVEIGFIHQAAGKILIRNPALFQVRVSSENC